jgi:hypothetical protein
MKKLILVIWIMTLFTLTGRSVYACSCGDVKGPIVFKGSAVPPDAEAIKKWRLEQTEFAFFVGSVVKIEKVKMKSAGSDDRLGMKKVTVRVEKYWLGVKTPELIIYTGIGGGDCGVPYVKGKQYFFGASRGHASGLLETGICSPSAVTDKTINAFNDVFGGAKEFR